MFEMIFHHKSNVLLSKLFNYEISMSIFLRDCRSCGWYQPVGVLQCIQREKTSEDNSLNTIGVIVEIMESDMFLQNTLQTKIKNPNSDLN